MGKKHDQSLSPPMFTMLERLRTGGGELWSPEVKLCFSLLQQIPSPPPPSSSAAAASTTSVLFQIYGFILRRGLDSNLPLLTRLISCFSNLASAAALAHARRVFDLRRSQDAVLCNSMIRSLVLHRRFGDSLALYRHLRRHHQPQLDRPLFSPDCYTFPLLLKSCASSSDDQTVGSQIHTHVVKMGFSRHVFTATGLLDMYGKTSNIESARKMFDEMPERSLASWTSMTLAYTRAGDVGSAMVLFRAMPDRDTAAFNAMIDSLVKSGDVGSARALFNEMPVRNVISWTSLMYGYCEVGDMDSARALFDEMPEKNLFSWNVMIGGYCRNRRPELALELFRELQSGLCPFQPDEVTIVSVLPAIADMGAIDLGRWIHNYVRRKGIDHGVGVSTTLVDMYAKCGEISEARRVFDGMPDKCTASWNAMINGLAVNGRPREALDLFTEMQRDGVDPNEVTMVGVLSACSHGGLVDEGRRWFGMMDAFGISREVEHYGCMVDLLGRGGYLEEAERVIEEMPCGPSDIILSSMLFACLCHEDVGRAERVMRRIGEVEPWNVRNYVMLRNMYAREKRWADVERMKELMRRLGGKREAGCSVVEVGSRVWEFVSGDKVHPQWEVIYSVIAQLQLHMKAQRMKVELQYEELVS